MNFRQLFLGLSLISLMSPCFANPYQENRSYNSAQQSPAMVLKQGIDKLTNFLASGNGPNIPPLDVFVENNIAPFFDFTYMARWTAGSQARFMNEQQQKAMEQKLRQLFLTAMIEKLSEYRHGRVQYLRPTGNPRMGQMTLRLMAFQQGNPYPQRLSFRMYRSNQGWKVFDVSANGQSALAFFRTQFALEAQQDRRRQRGSYPSNMQQFSYPRY